MAVVFTYNPLLSSTLDHARFHLGDTNENAPLLDDNTITSQLNTYGWSQGLANLASGLLSRYGREPVKYDEGGGIIVDLTGRLEEWRRLYTNAINGRIPDPTTVNNTSYAGDVKISSGSADINVNW